MSHGVVASTVILGASNVSRGLGVLVQRARAVERGQRILVAAGRGRSYGLRSRMLGRSLGGIVSSDVWNELESSSGPVRALVTDVGNDVLYGVATGTLLGWIETCLGRLADRGATTVVTGLPLQRLLAMSPRAFGFWKRVFFPARHLDYGRARDQVCAINEGLIALAKDHGAHLVQPDAAWYGLDPIHIRHGLVRTAWATMLLPWGQAVEEAPMGLWRRTRFSFASARGSRFWGVARRGVVWPDGDGGEVQFL